jgi:hypothetical protein
MSGRLGPYRARGYTSPDDEPWAAPHDPGVYDPGDWYDEGLAYGVGLAYGTPGLFGPDVTSVDVRVADEGFVPPPRAPIEQPGPNPGAPAPPPVSRHRRRSRFTAPSWPRLISATFGALTALTVTAVCALGWALSYDPLRDLAFSRVPRGLSLLWPVVVYGPWLAGCLSVLRAAIHGRPPVHSWVVVVLFSTLATGLCVADVSWTVPSVVVAGLPPLTAVISLHQLVRQLTAARGTRQRFGHPAAHKAPRT